MLRAERGRKLQCQGTLSWWAWSARARRTLQTSTAQSSHLPSRSRLVRSQTLGGPLALTLKSTWTELAVVVGMDVRTYLIVPIWPTGIGAVQEGFYSERVELGAGHRCWHQPAAI